MNKVFRTALTSAASFALVLGVFSAPANAATSLNAEVELFSLGGATVSGIFSANSVITATPNQWSRTNGGAAVTTTNTYDWLVCTMAQTNSTTNAVNVPCIMNGGVQSILADGNSIGAFSGSGAKYTAATLTITQNLLNLLNGKYLMVVVRGTVTNPNATSNVLMQTCGPISAGLPCSVAFGTALPVVVPPAGDGTTTGGGTTTAATPTLTAQTAPATVPATIKAKKKLKISAKSSAGLPVKVTVAGGCKVKPVVKTTKTKVGKKTVKTKTVTAYTVTMGKKKRSTCTITQANAGDATYAPLNSVSTVTLR